MKKTSIQIGSALFALTAVIGANQAAYADKDETTETRDLKEFTEVRVYGAFSGTIVAGQEPGISISGDEEILPYVITDVDGETLKIKLKKNRIREHSIRLEIGTMSLNEVRIDGAGNFDISGVDSDEFRLNLPGASKLSVSGKCDELDIRISGFASIEAKDLECNAAVLRISGHGKVSVLARESVETRISGLGKVEVFGEPEEIEQRISGLGRVSFVEE